MSQAGNPYRYWLFDPIPRLDHRLPRRTEPAYSYLNESARPEAALNRLYYRTWLARYPARERADLVRRFRSRDDRAHTAAAFELFLHELLVSLGAGVTIPEERQGQTRYDFDVEEGDSVTAVEAAVVSDEDEDDRVRQRRRDELLDHLDQMRHPRLAVAVREAMINPSNAPPYGRLREAMIMLLDSATEDQIAQSAGHIAARDFGSLPRWRYERDGSRVVLSPVPIPPGVQLRGHGVELPENTLMQAITVGDALLAKLRTKASRRYDLGDRPLVLALASTHWGGASDDQVFRELLGTERHPVVRSADGNATLGQPFRDRDGSWGPHSRHGLTSVSAVLIFYRFQVWNPWDPRWHAYMNPWARTPPPAWLQRLPRWVSTGDGFLHRYDGIALRDLVGPPVEPVHLPDLRW